MHLVRGQLAVFSGITLIFVALGCGSSEPAPAAAKSVPATQAQPAAANPAPAAQPAAAPQVAANPGAPNQNPGGPNMAQMQQQMQQMNGNAPGNNGAPKMAGMPNMQPGMPPNPGAPKMAGPNMPGMAGAPPKMPNSPNMPAMPNNPGMAGANGNADAKKKKTTGPQPGGGMSKNAQANAAGPGMAGGPGGRMGPGMGPGGQMAGNSNNQGGGGQGDGKQKFAPGSPDEVLFNFCTALADDDTATASDYISPKATKDLAKLRDGDLTEEKIEEIVDLFVPMSELTPVQDPTGGSKRMLRNGKNQVITFTLKKEKEAYKITELTYTKQKRGF